MNIVVFRCRLRDGVGPALESEGARMYDLASRMPGFISYREYTAADGENVSLIEFESLEAIADWRMHSEHVEVHRHGREEFFAEFRIQGCSIERDYAFP